MSILTTVLVFPGRYCTVTKYESILSGTGYNHQYFLNTNINEHQNKWQYNFTIYDYLVKETNIVPLWEFFSLTCSLFGVPHTEILNLKEIPQSTTQVFCKKQ